MAWVIRYLGAAYTAQRSIVIPAKAGIHFDLGFRSALEKSKWIPAFAGMTECGS